MWAAVVDRNGLVVAVVFTGATNTDQWPGSRVIAAQKANTGNAFSLPHLALRPPTCMQPPSRAARCSDSRKRTDQRRRGLCGNAADYGSRRDFMVGSGSGDQRVRRRPAAVRRRWDLVGGLGVSGDASCADHNIAWKMRYNLRLDHVPAGVADNGKDDNIIYDFTNGVSASGFGHPSAPPPRRRSVKRCRRRIRSGTKPGSGGEGAVSFLASARVALLLVAPSHRACRSYSGKRVSGMKRVRGAYTWLSPSSSAS